MKTNSNRSVGESLALALAIGAAGLSGSAAAAPGDDSLATYQRQGGGPFSAAAGERAFTVKHQTEGESRSCTTCHGTDLTKPGKHAKTGKPSTRSPCRSTPRASPTRPRSRSGSAATAAGPWGATAHSRKRAIL